MEFWCEIKLLPARHSVLESELENLQAQLSRFQLHVTSVTEDILSMESKLNSTIMTLKKTLVSDPFSCRMCTRAWFTLAVLLLFSLFAFSFFYPSCSRFPLCSLWERLIVLMQVAAEKCVINLDFWRFSLKLFQVFILCFQCRPLWIKSRQQ